MSHDQTLSDLEFYLGYTPDGDVVAEAGDWQEANPGASLAEWVDAMAAIGAL